MCSVVAVNCGRGVQMQIFSAVKLRHSFIYLHNEKTLKGFPGTLVGPNALKSALSHVESVKPTSLGSESRPQQKRD